MPATSAASRTGESKRPARPAPEAVERPARVSTIGPPAPWEAVCFLEFFRFVRYSYFIHLLCDRFTACFQKIQGLAQAVFDGACGDAQHLGGLAQRKSLVIVQMHRLPLFLVKLLHERVQPRGRLAPGRVLKRAGSVGHAFLPPFLAAGFETAAFAPPIQIEIAPDAVKPGRKT